MLISIKCKVYLINCTEEMRNIVNKATEEYCFLKDKVEICIAEKPTEEMRGNCLILYCIKYMQQLESWTKDTEMILISDNPDMKMLQKGFVDIFAPEFDEERFTASYNNMISLCLKQRHIDLRESMIGTYFEISDDMLWTKDINDYHMDINHSIIQLTGKPRVKIEGRHEVEVYDHATDDQGCSESDRYVRENGRMKYYEESMPGADGKSHHLQVTKAPWLDGQGKIIGTIGLARDVTELMNQQTKFDMFLNSLDIAVVILDNDGIVVQANEVFLIMMNSRAINIIGQEIAAIEYEKLHKGDYLEDDDFIAISPAGRETIWNRSTFVLNDYWGQQSGNIHIFLDVTYEREQSRRIRKMAVNDVLTGLANRAGMYEYFDTIENNGRATFMYIDIDNFKLLNDKFGHCVGDKFLIDLSNMFKSILKDAFVARMGGDEFFAILNGEYSEEDIIEASDELQRIIKKFQGYPDGALEFMSLSIGILNNVSVTDNVDDIIIRCDAAMYSAKKSGKGQHNIESELF